MTSDARRDAVHRAIVSAGSAEGWDATLPLVRSLLERMQDACDADAAERSRQADWLQRAMLDESPSFLDEPVAADLFTVIVAFRQRT